MKRPVFINVVGKPSILLCGLSFISALLLYWGPKHVVSCVRVQLKYDGARWSIRGKWRRIWRIEWVASTLHTTSEHGVSSITTADAHTSAELTSTADLNGLVRLAERRNLVSARVPSHFRRSLTHTAIKSCTFWLQLMAVFRSDIIFCVHINKCRYFPVTNVLYYCSPPRWK